LLAKQSQQIILDDVNEDRATKHGNFLVRAFSNFRNVKFGKSGSRLQRALGRIREKAMAFFPMTDAVYFKAEIDNIFGIVLNLSQNMGTVDYKSNRFGSLLSGVRAEIEALAGAVRYNALPETSYRDLLILQDKLALILKEKDNAPEEFHGVLEGFSEMHNRIGRLIAALSISSERQVFLEQEFLYRVSVAVPCEATMKKEDKAQDLLNEQLYGSYPVTLVADAAPLDEQNKIDLYRILYELEKLSRTSGADSFTIEQMRLNNEKTLRIMYKAGDTWRELQIAHFGSGRQAFTLVKPIIAADEVMADAGLDPVGVRGGMPLVANHRDIRPSQSQDSFAWLLSDSPIFSAGRSDGRPVPLNDADDPMVSHNGPDDW
jgi:hypothetical protein